MVLVGRAAPAVLARERDALHVKVVAPRAVPDRRGRRAAQASLAEAAAKLVDDSDEKRARYHQQYYRRDWNDPVNYHMVLNTGALGLDGRRR